jgi:TonB family protein
MMSRSLAAFLLLLPILSSAADRPFDRKQMEDKIKQVLVGKVAVMQKFYTERDLHFDPQGNLVGTAKTGPWTAYGRVEIKAVRLTDTRLQLTGCRNVMRWEGTELANYTLDNDLVRISIALPPQPSGEAISALLAKIFLFRALRISDVVPDYWKDFLTTERARSAERLQYQAMMMKDIKPLDDAIKPPKLLSKAKGIEIGGKPFQNPDANTVVLQFIVDAGGNVKDVQITKPVGVGADDPIAEEIEQWKFEPAMSGGNPVGVVMYAQRQVRFEKQQGMPLHPCPLATEISQCQ